MSEQKRLCKDCAYYPRCQWLISSVNEQSVECDWTPSRWQPSEAYRLTAAEQERDSLKQQITELDKSTDDLQFKVKAVERLVGVLEKQLAERDAALERAVAAQNSLNIQLDHMKGIWDERGDEIRTLKEQLAEANAELDLTTDLLAKQNIAAANMRKALETNFNAIRTINCSPLDCDDCLTGQATRMFSPRCSYRHAIMAGNKTLSSDVGKDLLERVRRGEEAERLLKRVDGMQKAAGNIRSSEASDWGGDWEELVERIDAYLKRGEKE